MSTSAGSDARIRLQNIAFTRSSLYMGNANDTPLFDGFASRLGGFARLAAKGKCCHIECSVHRTNRCSLVEFWKSTIVSRNISTALVQSVPGP